MCCEQDVEDLSELLRYLQRRRGAKRIALRGSGRGSERVAQRVSGHVAERVAQRLAERLDKHAFERGAQRVAQRVASSGQSVTLEPMPPNERRVVHMALSDFPGVETTSIGDGDGRQVVVGPTF